MEIVLIPGIGGHPSFHHSLAVSLAQHGRLCTAEHGDFRREPFRTLAEHTRYWKGTIEALGSGQKILIGVSFGSCIAVDLLSDPPAGISSLVLISHWPLGRLERSLLRLIRALPRGAASQLFGWSLFSWSETTADDVKALRRLRRMLYDSNRNTFRRLLARLLCLIDYRHNLQVALDAWDTTLVWGESEIAFRLKGRVLRRAATRTSNQIIAVPGGHSISTRLDTDLARTIGDIIGRSRRQ